MIVQTGMPCVAQMVLSLDRGGLEAMAVDLAIGLKDHGVRSVVIALDGGGLLEDRLHRNGIEYGILGTRRSFGPSYHAELVSMLRRHRVDVVHTHMFAPLLHAIPATLRVGIRRLTHTEHSSEYLHGQRRLQIALRLMSRRTSAFTLVGQRMQAYYAHTIGVNEHRIRVIPNGIEVGSETATGREMARKELGIPRDAFVIASAGRLAPEKNYQMLLRAAADARRKGADIHVLLFGDGVECDSLVRLAADLGIADRLVLPGWRVDLARLLPAADAFALTSISEGLPLALLEGMAASLPPICTPVGDIPEIIHDGCSGFLIPLDRTELLVQRIMQLVAEPSLRSALGAAARSVVVTRYSRDAMIRQYLDAYGISSVPLQPYT
jgi:glycosyltransferase involved in cell wall biosynthesis